MPPADSASRAGVTPKASGDPSSGTLGKEYHAMFNSIIFLYIAMPASVLAFILSMRREILSARTIEMKKITRWKYIVYCLLFVIWAAFGICHIIRMNIVWPLIALAVVEVVFRRIYYSHILRYPNVETIKKENA
jgi:hypothetical protein